MRIRCEGALAATLLALSSAASDASEVVETFENGVNVGGWTYFVGFPHPLAPDGGNPGWHVPLELCCDFFPPNLLTTTDGSAFTGDYRAAGVTHLALDVKIDAILPPEFTVHTMSLFLGHDNDTPGDASDDWGAWFTGGAAQEVVVDGAWRTIGFDIPSASPTLPAGWELRPDYPLNQDPDLPPGASWSKLITDVACVSFEHGPPVPVFFVDHWIAVDLHHDNPTICFAVPGDIDGDGDVDTQDLLGLLAQWGPCADGEPCPADVDGNGTVGASDLLVLLANWS